MVEEEGEDSPRKGYHGDDKQDQNVLGHHDIVGDIAVDEVGQHAHYGDEGEDLGESPEDEADCEKHLGSGCPLSSGTLQCSVFR